MPRADYKNCRVCERHESEVGPLSNNRLCASCGGTRFGQNLVSMKTMSGPFAHHWRRQMAASVGGILLDEPDTKA